MQQAQTRACCEEWEQALRQAFRLDRSSSEARGRVGINNTTSDL